MKKISSILFAAAIALAGCTLTTPDVEAVIDSRAVRYTASFEGIATRTYVDSRLRMFWTADDRLSIFTSTYNQQYVFMGKTGDNSGEFAKVSSGGFVSGGALSTNYAVYPYNSATSISYDGEISLTLPAVQKYSEGTFGLGANTMVAVTEDGDDTFLSFKNICGYLVVRFYGDATIKSVTLTGNDNERIAGKATVTQLYNSNPETIIADDATTTITIDCGEGVKLGSTADAATEFWFCVPPTTFNKGFTISAEDINGRTYSKSTSASRTITRNIVNAMSALKYAPEEPYEMVDLGLSVKWAFCNLDANRPEQFGGYYQWAGLQDVTSTSIYLGYSNCPCHTGSDKIAGWTKYVTSSEASYWSGPGSPDNKTVLDPEDDVAHVKLGGKWRIPTDEEWTELMDNCTWTWTTLNGVKGYRVTSKKNGNSIFLPAAGYRYGTNLFGAGSNGNYWSSSHNTVTTYVACDVYFGSGGVHRDDDYRYDGLSVRPVYGDAHAAVISLDITNLILTEGCTQTLTATITPSNAANKNVTWSSSNTLIATVSSNGVVTAKSAGTATITVKTSDGSKTATCQVTITSSGSEYSEYVDLGLSVKWATCNLDSNLPEQYGGYYQWAGLQDVTSTSIDLGWSNCPYHTGSDSNTGWTKYVPSDKSSYWSGSGSPDNKTVLDPEDDVAHVKLGGKWRIPTDEEWTELMDNCTWTWTTLNGVKGYWVTSKKTGNSIFLPTAGCRYGTGLYYVGSYWSSSLFTDFLDHACGVYFFYSGNVYRNGNYRYYGRSVRPVSE